MVIDAEFTEIKSKKKNGSSKSKKLVNKNPSMKPKSLPAPKKKEAAKPDKGKAP